MSVAARNKATFHRLHEAMNSRDPEIIAKAVDEVAAPNVRMSTPLPIDATGAEAFKQIWAMLLHAFPDLHVKVEDLIAEDDKVVIRNTVTGTHRGEYMGVPPTGKRITYNEIFIFRFAEDRITETWGIVNVLSQMRQLGLLPEPPS
ncbi:ester cyclase [Kribbella sp. NPDC049174]|uniref:ester cyclase n=1 Tax=Kribbella sp. NPDC049174 TaxID=3364112 RepID=UPI0037168A84